MDPCGTPNFTKSKFVFFFVIYLNILLSVIQSFLNHLKKLLHLFYQQISFFNSENHFIQHIFYKTVLVGNVLFWWEMFSRTAILINIFLGGLSVVNCSLYVCNVNKRTVSRCFPRCFPMFLREATFQMSSGRAGVRR